MNNITTLMWLVRRELWEHRGSLLITPLVIGGVFLLINLLAWGFGEFQLSRGPWPMDLAALTATLPDLESPRAQAMGQAWDGLLVAPAIVMALVMGVVVMAYAVGALYNERRDRSVLFWKSLPLSDAQVVASKALVALVVAPLYAWAVGLLTGLLLLIGVVLVLAMHGLPLLWAGTAHPVRTIGLVLAVWPLTLLLALPTVGWLLLCSAWARSKPFLWAIVLPVGATLMLTWLRWMGAPVSGISLSPLLLGTFPGLTLMPSFHALGNLSAPMAWVGHLWHTALTSPSVWAGIGVGAVALAGAIQGRRKAVVGG